MPRTTKRPIDTDGIIDEALRMALVTADETIAILANRHPGSSLIERLRIFQEDIRTIVAQRNRR